MALSGSMWGLGNSPCYAQDSLDHGVNTDDHHGPGPLSAAGRQQGTVRAKPGRIQQGPHDHGPSPAARDPLLHTTVRLPFWGEQKKWVGWDLLLRCFI